MNFGKLCLGGVLLFSLSMSLTSCEDILGHWEKPTPNPITPGGNVTPSDEGGSTPVLPTLDLSTVTAATTIQDGYRVTGTLGANVNISIAAGATVTLDGVTINGVNNSSYKWAGITCEGDATIILKDGTTNTVKGFYEDYPGILAAVGHTLIIKGGTAGTGSLEASSNGYGAGIGGGNQIACGNIEIQGGKITATGGFGDAGIGSGYKAGCGSITISDGTVTATGGLNAAGIGRGNNGSGGSATCGNITISGGTVTATGGQYGAGIGSGKFASSLDGAITITISGGTVSATGGQYGAGIGSGNQAGCGAITITADVTSVTATKGSDATNSIGAGNSGTCGIVTIGGNVGAKTASPYIYPTPVPSTAINGKFTINASGDQVYFAKGNLQATTTDGGTSWSWGFAENQYDFISYAGGNILINGNGSVSAAGTVDLFGWSTAATTYGIHNSENASDYSGDFVDWGGNIGTGWRTLSKDEWNYLFSSRINGGKINGLSGATNVRYTHATITDIGTDGIHGIILFPDGVTINYSDATYWGGINQYSSWSGSTKCTTSQWNALAAKGFVFLPAAGVRNGIVVSYPNNNGYYWSSYTTSSNNAHYTRVVSAVEPTTSYDSRNIGISVRLVYPID